MKNIKLTPAQQKVMDRAYKDIDEARNNDFYGWFKIAYKCNETKEEIDERVERWYNRYHENYYHENYEKTKNGMVLTHCNTKTLRKLEEMGLIKIIEDSTGTKFGLDVVQVLNY